jgi:hypothetical protein
MKMDSVTAFPRRSLVLGFVAALASSVVPARATRRAGEHPAKKFIGSIYQHYLGKSSAAAGLPLTDAQSVRSYFTTGLAELILDDRAAATKHGGSPVLNSDPFIGHGEWDISDISVDVKDTAGFKTVGTVSFLNFGKPEKVGLELLRSGNEWRIADVAWDSGTLRGLYRRKAADNGHDVFTIEDSHASERVDLPVKETPAR